MSKKKKLLPQPPKPIVKIEEDRVIHQYFYDDKLIKEVSWPYIKNQHVDNNGVTIEDIYTMEPTLGGATPNHIAQRALNRPNKFLDMKFNEKELDAIGGEKKVYRDAKGRFIPAPAIKDCFGILAEEPRPTTTFELPQLNLWEEFCMSLQTLLNVKRKIEENNKPTRWQKFKNKIRKLLLWRR